jgi:hypothetical protein
MVSIPFRRFPSSSSNIQQPEYGFFFTNNTLRHLSDIIILAT